MRHLFQVSKLGQMDEGRVVFQVRTEARRHLPPPALFAGHQNSDLSDAFGDRSPGAWGLTSPSRIGIWPVIVPQAKVRRPHTDAKRQLE